MTTGPDTNRPRWITRSKTCANAVLGVVVGCGAASVACVAPELLGGEDGATGAFEVLATVPSLVALDAATGAFELLGTVTSAVVLGGALELSGLKATKRPPSNTTRASR